MSHPPAIYRIADRLAPDLRNAFLAAIAEIRDDVTLAVLTAAIESGVPSAIVAAIRLAQLPVALEPAVAVVEQIVTEAAAHAFTEIAVRASLTIVNPSAAVAAQTQGARLIQAITTETQAAIRALTARAVTEGIAPRELAALIKPLIGLTTKQTQAVLNAQAAWQEAGLTGTALQQQVDGYAAKLLKQRAVNIARTETIAAANAGQRAAWNDAVSAGLLKKDRTSRIWSAASDGRVCPRCEGLDEVVVDFDEAFVDKDGTSVDAPPLHPSCLPGDSLVLPCGGIAASSDRRYDGDLLIIRTAGGQHLACTPNHPILSDRGWLPARRLHVGGYVVRARFSEWHGFRHQQDEHVPARIQEIAKAVGRAQQMPAVPVPVAAVDFHGDGRGAEVAVIRTNRLLGNRDEAARRQQRREATLGRRDMQPFGLHGLRMLDFSRHRDGHEARCGMCGRDLPRALRRRHRGPLEPLTGALIPHLDAVFAQTMVDDRARDAEVCRELIHGPPVTVARRGLLDRKGDAAGKDDRRAMAADDDAGLAQALIHQTEVRDTQIARDLHAGRAGPVFADRVVEIKHHRFAGHVFNLETASSVYLVGDIVSHNCRCSVSLVFDRARSAA